VRNRYPAENSLGNNWRQIEVPANSAAAHQPSIE
jgi:hypothetical protein